MGSSWRQERWRECIVSACYAGPAGAVHSCDTVSEKLPGRTHETHHSRRSGWSGLRGDHHQLREDLGDPPRAPAGPHRSQDRGAERRHHRQPALPSGLRAVVRSSPPDLLQPSPGGRVSAASYAQAPSAALLVWEHYGKDPKYDALVEETNRLDSAQLTEDDVLRPERYILLGYTIDSRTGLGAFEVYFRQCVEWVKQLPIEEVLRKPMVAERVQRLQEEDRNFRRSLTESSRLEGNVIFTDFRNEVVLPIGNRFLVYTLFPQANVSLRVHWGPGPGIRGGSGGPLDLQPHLPDRGRRAALTLRGWWAPRCRLSADSDGCGGGEDRGDLGGVAGRGLRPGREPQRTLVQAFPKRVAPFRAPRSHRLSEAAGTAFRHRFPRRLAPHAPALRARLHGSVPGFPRPAFRGGWHPRIRTGPVGPGPGIRGGGGSPLDLQPHLPDRGRRAALTLRGWRSSRRRLSADSDGCGGGEDRGDLGGFAGCGLRPG